MKKLRVLSVVLAGALLTVSGATAQTTTGRLLGVVRDADGAALPGATVTVSGETLPGGDRFTQTGATGDYRFTALPPGSYSVEAALDGFEAQKIEGVRVSLGASATVDLALRPEFSEALTVTGEHPLVDLSSAGTSTLYTAEFMEDLPTSRNFYDLMQVAPGVSKGTEDSDRTVAYGSNVQSNSWFIDGIETAAPETGSVWVSVNPDAIEEIQVTGIGASAEYGNMLGAALNVVTKSGGNSFKGGANIYWFDNSLVDSKITRSDTPFPDYNQGEFLDITGTLGGPIKKDRLWFFGSYEHWRDLHTFPGQDPNSSEWFSDKYDLKLTGQLNPSNMLELKGYRDAGWGFPAALDGFTELSASQGEEGDTTAWGLSYQSILSDSTFLEVRYSGWESTDLNLSQTGSTESAFIDASPPGGGPTLFFGGAYYPWTYDTSTDQASVSVSHFADDFIKGDHDFKFGIQASQGEAATKVLLSATGTYYYHYAYVYDYYGTDYVYDYFYKVEGPAYFYGNDQDSLALFVDDSWKISDRLTLSLGVRYDQHEGRIPSFPRLDPQGNPTGETIPGVDMFKWNYVSPRIGFAYNAGANKDSVIRGSFGVYYDGNVGGNWNYPPVDFPPQVYSLSTEGFDGPYEFQGLWYDPGDALINPDLEAPRTLQYALGWEKQFGDNYSFGVQGIFKDTTDLIGWEILDDGIHGETQFTDPFTGQTFTIFDYNCDGCQFPSIRKGNKPGVTVDPNADEYFQEYYAAVVTLNRRFTGRWSMQASYTYSESTGLIPRFHSQYQFNPFYSSRQGSHPNSYLGIGDGITLTGDRPHMFRVLGNFELPWNLHANASVNLQSGRPFYRQFQLPGGGGSFSARRALLDTGLRHPTQRIVDLGLGRVFSLGDRFELKLDVQVLNLLNDDGTDWFETTVLADGDSFIPIVWVKPRRIQLRAGFAF